MHLLILQSHTMDRAGNVLHVISTASEINPFNSDPLPSAQACQTKHDTRQVTVCLLVVEKSVGSCNQVVDVG